MRTIFLLLLVSGFAACGNNSAPGDVQNEPTATAAPTLGPIADSATKLFELNFINSCMENAKLTLGEAKAFAFCKCMYGQVQAKYPGLDGSIISKLDSAEIGRMAANCR